LAKIEAKSAESTVDSLRTRNPAITTADAEFKAASDKLDATRNTAQEAQTKVANVIAA